MGGASDGVPISHPAIVSATCGDGDRTGWACEDGGMSEQQPRRPSRRRDAPERGASASRLDEVFGDVLPATTSDEREHPTARDAADGDTWYLENRPPHHG